MRIALQSILWYFLLAIFVFGLGGMIAFVLVSDAVRVETDYELLGRLYQTKRALRDGAPIRYINNSNVHVSVLDKDLQIQRDSFYQDTIIYLRRTGREESFRKLVAFQPINNQNYRIEIVDIIFEQEDILGVVSQIILRLFLFMSLAILIGSVLISIKLTNPFRSILLSIKNFSLKSNQPLDLPETNVYEFKKMNAFLEQMTDKARKDYQSLKEFTENASHELQTPIAIAKGKLELLEQDPSINTEQYQLIEATQHSLTKLSKLGNALSLLTKIENQEFITTAYTDFSEIVRKTSSLFKEIAQLQNVDLQAEIQPDVQLRVDAILADVLVTNLLKNAIQHNVPDGWVKLQLTKGKLIVQNSGEPLSVEPDALFTRFKKSNQTTGSLGLGLAIVKKICEVNGFTVAYKNEETLHQFEVVLDG